MGQIGEALLCLAAVYRHGQGLGLAETAIRLILRAEVDRTVPQQLFAPAPAIRPGEPWDEREIAAFADLMEQHADGIAAVILEPVVQGAGGMRFYHPDYLRHVRKLCDRFGILLIADEIATGFGRTGDAFWGFETQGVMPDIVTMAKGIGNGAPLAAVVTTPAIAESMVGRIHFNTFGGNPVFISGGAALDPVVAERLMELGLNVYQGYGITETSPVIAVETPAFNRLGTVGRPMSGIEIMIHEPNAEGVGEIWVKGPNIMLGYYNNQAATDEVMTDGWYHTGDLGCVDEDGALRICGRAKNLIVTANGKNVYPKEVENEISNIPFIAEIMVYGHKVDNTSEEVCALIYPHQEALDAYAEANGTGPLSLQDVEEIIRKEILERGKALADYKRIKRFTLREDEFPKTTTRKIKRFVVEADIQTGG